MPEHLLQERKLDMSKKEDAAEYLIKQSWKYIPASEDRYDSHDVILWIDNEPQLSNLAWSLAKNFYPQDEEAWYSFKNDVEQVLARLEQERLERRRSQTPSLKDPLYVLKKLMVNTTWNQAKMALAKQFPGRVLNRPDDESAEIMFNRLYKNAMGETMYNKEEIAKWGYGRLSDLVVREVPNDADHKQYVVNIFLRQYFSGKQPSGSVRVWRGTNNPHTPIRPGDFVTFDRGYAQGYMSGKWKAIVTEVIDVKDLITYKLDPGMSEFLYWPEGHEIKPFTGEIPKLRDFWQQYRFGL